jgi:hypothetical protein
MPPQFWGEPEFKVSNFGGTGVQSPPELGDLGGFLLHCIYTTFSPPSPPSLGGTGIQSPPELEDLGGFHRLV